MKSENNEKSSEIDELFASYSGWKGDTISKLRSVILSVDPEIREEVKWKKPSNPSGIPVWYRNGIICFANILKKSVRLTFPKGAFINLPGGTFNERLNSKSVRALDFYEDSQIDEKSVSLIIRNAIEINTGEGRK